MAGQVVLQDEPSGPDTVDGEILRLSVARLANEASDLGLHLVDIAGAIQDTAAQSSAHATGAACAWQSRSELTHPA